MLSSVGISRFAGQIKTLLHVPLGLVMAETLHPPIRRVNNFSLNYIWAENSMRVALNEDGFASSLLNVNGRSRFETLTCCPNIPHYISTHYMISYASRFIALPLLVLFCVARIASQTATPATATGTNAPVIAQAQSLLRAGKFDAAIELLRSLSGSSSNDSTATNLLGVAYYQKGDYGHAIEQLTAVVREKH